MSSKRACTANAQRIAGNLYDVTYSDGRDMDRRVSGRYLVDLLKRGAVSEVRVDQQQHHGDGERPFEVLRIDAAGEVRTV